MKGGKGAEIKNGPLYETARLMYELILQFI